MRFIIYDTEVFKYDFLAIFKDYDTKEYFIFPNDGEGIKDYISQNKDAVFVGFNNKHYDRFVTAAMVNTNNPLIVKSVNDFIIEEGQMGWNYPDRDTTTLYFNQCDLMDDCQQGLSLKAIEAHLGWSIEETEVDFNLSRPLTREEMDLTIKYCTHDVDATEMLLGLRKDYLNNKIMLGGMKGLSPEKSVGLTNAKLTALYLDADPVKFNDEREYKYPNNLLREYIPENVFAFFDRMADKSVSDDELFGSKLSFKIGECEVTLGFGGIHGAIPHYREKSTNTRTIRNQDVGSYYPHLMTIDGYCSRAIPNPSIYAEMLERRMKAKKAGDKVTANALKLVANTTYGAMLNKYNALYDPLMGRSVCITGQLRLLELTMHLVKKCPSVKIIQLNTDGIMISIDSTDLPMYEDIVKEWQDRTKFTLEEDIIAEIIQKDVNGYVEIATDGHFKIKGGMLVRGIAKAGAFNVNNNNTVVAKAVVDYFTKDIPVEDTINAETDPSAFMMISKASSKYSEAFYEINGKMHPTQKCNRVFATDDEKCGKLYKKHKETKSVVKQSGLPKHCIIQNSSEITLDKVDRLWYIKEAKKVVNAFLGKEIKLNNRKINTLTKQALKLLED